MLARTPVGIHDILLCPHTRSPSRYSYDGIITPYNSTLLVCRYIIISLITLYTKHNHYSAATTLPR